MKKGKKKLTKQDYINYILIFLLLICFIVIGKINYPKNEENKVKEPVNITLLPKDNVFVKVSANDVYKKLLSGDALVFFALSNSKNCDYYAKALDEVAKSLQVDEIMYYDVSSDRKNSNGTYGLIEEYLIDYLENDDQGNIILHTPAFLIVKNGEIIFYDSLERQKANSSADEYWNNYNYNLKKAYIEAGLNNYLSVLKETE